MDATTPIRKHHGAGARLAVPLLLLVWLAAAVPVFAHDPGLSAADLNFDGGTLRAHVTFSRKDVDPAAKPTVLEVRVNGRIVPPLQAQIETDDSNAVHFYLTFPVTPGMPLEIRATDFDRLARGHRQYFTLHDAGGKLLAEKILDSQHNSVVVTLTANPEQFTFRKFLLLGVEHILTGYDHLLFLFGLLLIGGSFRTAAKIITSFTVAHSITLALATFNIVSLPSAIVEPMIAASIVYVGIENIWHHNLDKRWLLTFGFGLVHGLGFATVLRDLGIGLHGTHAVIPLLSFNLGVELGQISIAAIVLPMIWSLRQRPVFVARWVPACSVVIALLGSYWFIQRTLF
ncbi:MAG TPA: HupE/UreJ family protein [Verrucomicrobiae bacterium]|nr:HupE/UreJ family protein [Verrucomicrobiae bacterium]